MSTCLVFDIETRPNEALWSDPEFCNEIREGIEPRGNLKDPVKIEADIDAKFDDLKAKAALNWQFGKIAAIACMDLNDGDQQVWASEDEGEVLEAFECELSLPLRNGKLGGWNIRDFDIPFVTARCAAHRIKLPSWWPHRLNRQSIVDPVDLFGRYTGLDASLRAFGLERKTATGEQSLAMSMEELADYCLADVKREADVIDLLRDHFEALNPKPIRERFTPAAQKTSGIGADPARELPFTMTELRDLRGVGAATERALREFFNSKGLEIRA